MILFSLKCSIVLCCLSLFILGCNSHAQLQVSAAAFAIKESLGAIDDATDLLIKAEAGERELLNNYRAYSYYTEALVFMQRSNYTLALSCIENSIDFYEKTIISPTYLARDVSNAWALKSAILFKLKRYDQAIEAAKTSTEKAPHNEYSWLVSGCIFHSLERYSEAIDCYDNTITVNPTNNGTKTRAINVCV